MLSVSNGRCVKLTQPSRRLPHTTDRHEAAYPATQSRQTLIPSDALLQQLQEQLLCFNWLWRSTAGENNGGACVAGSVHPLAPNTAESSPRQAIQPPPPLITSPSVSPCLQFRHVPVFLLSCLSVSFCLQPTKTAIQPWRWWAGGKMPWLHRSSAAGTALLSVAD